MNGKLLQPGDAHTQALSLGVFRFCYACMLFLEVCHLFYFRHLLLDPIPYLQPAPSLLTLLLVIWLGTIMCVIAGFHTTINCILNYLFTVLFLGILLYPQYEYHVDYVYTGVNFLLILTPVSDRFSLDAIRRRKKQQPTTARNYSVYIDALIFIGIALVYADSVFYKLTSPMWTGGLGVWLPASLPQNSWFDLPQIFLDQKWLMLTLGYLTVVFETTFPVLMWWRRSRPVLFIIGLGLHLSIGIVFPIPFFGLTYIALYLLLLPAGCWRFLDHKLHSQPTEVTESGEPQMKRSLQMREKLVFAMICITGLIQTCIAIGRFPDLADNTQSDILRPIVRALTNSCISVRKQVEQPGRILLGLTDHGVFMDSHFKNYSRQFAVRLVIPQKRDFILSLTTEDGTPGAYPTGRLWVNWCFRVNGPSVSKEGFEHGLRRLTAFWAFKNNISLQNAEFEVIARPLESSFEWKRGHLQTQKNTKWKPVGTATWKEQQFEFELLGKKTEPQQNVDPKSDESP